MEKASVWKPFYTLWIQSLTKGITASLSNTINASLMISPQSVLVLAYFLDKYT